MFLVVGLGNPDKQYASNRHNVGFMAADEIFRRYSFVAFSKKHQGLLADGTVDGTRVLILKPQTYMNLSGDSVLATAAFYKILPENILVIHDDLDLKFGDVRLKIGGGNAGHNGLKSIDGKIGKEYWRLRIGIGRPENKDMVSDYVLSNFSKDEQKELDVLLEKIADGLPDFFEKGSINGI